ncbi:Ethanolamine ammonia-lyase [Pseudodesulfovibrio mercurii]|uniref:Ethanolamine ammonia-lyase small subunit n=1 Tax=Pseudodesulfovibrio mercurii TaxID=641491 RepID=F0JDT2_9BACT|nr:ethanolamine ammonia-lyase subunit EutC [Pseudodesulfovibrio mercurii]EGB14614.1 Ethanolamine ammonia-lyase [Pseudodesulfovibrio mercurii]
MACPPESDFSGGDLAAADLVPEDFWAGLRAWTDARIALGRAGVGLRTRDVLAFQLDHARARDAVHQVLDREAAFGGIEYLEVMSRAPDRATFLRRPDLGRLLAPESEAMLTARAGKGCDVAFLVSAGLSSTAIERNFRPFRDELRPLLDGLGLRMGPLCFVEQGRVALGDRVALALRARMAVVVIGERPGLSAPDSMGVYMTYGPAPATTDEARNCISNIRPAGLDYARAARTLCALMREAFRRGLSGVDLKVDDALALAPGGDAETLAGAARTATKTIS